MQHSTSTAFTVLFCLTVTLFNIYKSHLKHMSIMTEAFPHNVNIYVIQTSLCIASITVDVIEVNYYD